MKTSFFMRYKMHRVNIQTSLQQLLLVTAIFMMAYPSEAFAPVLSSSRTSRQIHLMAESSDGKAAPPQPPQYDKIQAVLKRKEMVADGSVMLHLDASETVQATQQPLDYQPGHVLALEVQDESDDQADDTKANGGWMRGPYTVSRATDTTLDILIRVVGKKSRVLSEAEPGLPVRFGGQFKVPILEGVVNPEDVERVVLISTGVGMGPCIGAIELALQQNQNDDKSEQFAPIELFASFRNPSDVCCPDHLDALAKEHPTRFSWTPIITSETGRISSSLEQLKQVFRASAGETHFHVIGNGQLVNEWTAGLAQAGVPAERVTKELYFNSRAHIDPSAVENIAKAAAKCGAAMTTAK